MNTNIVQYEKIVHKKKKNIVANILYYAVGIILSLIFIIPFIYMIAASTKTQAEFALDVGTLRMFLPNFNLKQVIENYSLIFTEYNIWQYLFNTLIYAVAVIILNVIINGLAGYAISKFRFPGKKFYNFIIMFLIIVPVETSMIPLYTIVKQILNLNGDISVLAVILPQAISIFNIFLFIQFFKGIPTEYEEAARMDGASDLKIFFTIIVPLSKPIIATVAVFAFIGVWNDHIWPLWVLSDKSLRPIQAGLQGILANPNINTVQSMATLVLASLPIFVVYVVAQKYIVQGFGSAGLKL